ncbi:MAG: hypothetical protein HUJ29_02085 [Gammaproteobacteria bacterium]|nr:hypothetical protein [Gammaproteobacteria bacterium]
MKKVVAATALALASSFAHAGSTIATNPTVILAGIADIEYEQSLSKTAGFTVNYSGINDAFGSISLIGGSYKAAFGKDFADNSDSTFGKGLYWRAGVLSASVSSGTSSISGVLPVVAIGYDYKINKNFVASLDFGMLGAGLQVGYNF